METIILKGILYYLDPETGEVTPATKKNEIQPNYNFLNEEE